MKEKQTEVKTMKKGRESYSSAKLMARRHQRRDDAFERQVEHDTLTLKEKLDKCKFRAKKGMGESKREVARLTIKLEESKKTAPVPATPAAKSESVQTPVKKKYQKVKKS
jgi:hypothetical protein